MNLITNQLANHIIMTTQDLYNYLSKIIDNNITEIPYEGKEIDKNGLITDIIDLISEL